MKAQSRGVGCDEEELYQVYLNYLQQRGGKDAMKQFLLIDREMFG